MAEYVEKSIIFPALNKAMSENGALGMADVEDIIDDLPTADVQPVKRGKWCPPLMGQGKCDTYCERCHGKIMRNSTGIFEETPFCPHCGADMRGEENA